jgi:VIT1/CCC1 family predicted Fe2+/Mn2+ transporter
VIALSSPLADFGANYTGIGWLTLVLPIGFLAIVIALLYRAYKRDGGAPAAEGNETGGFSDSAAFLPLLPVFMLPLELALALTAVVVVLWWHTTRRAQR